MEMVKRAARGAGRLLRAMGREIAATIRFGAVRISVDHQGLNQNVNALGVAAGLAGLRADQPGDEDDERG